MQASPFFLRMLSATGELSLLSLLGLAQSITQSGLARPSTGAPLPAKSPRPLARWASRKWVAQFNCRASLRLRQRLASRGRRSKLVQLARTAVSVQQAAFEDLLRQARFQLTQSFYDVVAERCKLVFTNQERPQLGRLLAGYRVRLGTVAFYEVTRLKMLLTGVNFSIAAGALFGVATQDGVILVNNSARICARVCRWWPPSAMGPSRGCAQW